MERVAIILRKAVVPNRFRTIVLGCFTSNYLNENLICSGFFQERGKYFASTCFAAAAPLRPCSKKVTLVGVYNKVWSGDFDTFASGLSGIRCSCGWPVTVVKRKVSRYHWHAKVFVASKDGEPVVAVIGSSNITARAFGIRKDWNYEADVVLWDDANKAAQAIVRGALAPADTDSEGFGIIVSDYSSNDPINRGLTMREKLRRLLTEIQEASDVIE